MVDLKILIGGPQGGGIESAGQIALKAFVLKGYHVLGSREYQSNIMGAHSYYLVRVMRRRPRALTLPVDVLVALDAESVLTHFEEVRPGGFIVYDSGTANVKASTIAPMAKPLKERLSEFFGRRGSEPTVSEALKVAEERGVTPIGLPMKQLLRRVAEATERPLASISRTVNIMGLAAGLYLAGVELEYVKDAIVAQFSAKPKIIKPNVVAASMAVEHVSELHEGLPRLEDGPLKGKQLMVATGNELVAMAKLVGGLSVQTYYPITPSSDEALYLEEHRYFELNDVAKERLGLEKMGIVVLQTEDELSAINMAIGAALAGARAATSTSGPGFSLMNEAISYAVTVEAPILITLWMRAGPSTGIPTREGQQDLLHALFSGHGDTPKIVVASGDHLEAYWDTIKALEWAERFQTPVIHLVDKYLASSMISIEKREIEPRGYPIMRTLKTDGDLRYKVTEDGISPWVPLGSSTMVITGLEHTEDGFATEDPVARDAMMEKRRRKMETIKREIPEEERVRVYGARDADVVLVSWGSTKDPILSAMETLEGEGVGARFVQIRTFFPFPEGTVSRELSEAKTVIGVEQNLLGQAAFLVRAFTGYRVRHMIFKLNGRPIFDDEIVYGVKRILETGEETVVVRGGS